MGLTGFLYFKKIRPFAIFIIVGSVAGSLVAILTLGPQIYYWMYIWPSLIFYFLGKRTGVFILLIFLISVGIVAWCSNFSNLGNHAIYDFIGSLGLVCLLAYLTEDFRDEIEKKLVWMAHTDQLTGLHNRHSFENLINHDLHRSHRYSEELAIIMLDLDNFKKINDQYGHQKGDQVLIDVAGCIKKSIRNCDSAARWGGEEFLVLAPQTNLYGACTLAKKIRKSFQNLKYVSGPEKITASFGISNVIGKEDIDSLLSRADQALYMAKTKGKDRVELAKNTLTLN